MITIDSDKLGRYSKEGLSIDSERFNMTHLEAYKRPCPNLDRLFLTASAELIVRDELAKCLSDLEGR